MTDVVIWILDIFFAVIGENLRFSLKDIRLLSCYFINFSVI